MVLFLISVSVALVISAICSLMEATLLSLTPSQVADIAKIEPQAGSIWQRFKANIQPPIAAILLLNTAAHTMTLGVRYNREVARYIAKPLNMVVLAFNPFTKAIHYINRPFEGQSLKPERSATIEEITALAGLARLSNQISSYQERIIHGASRLAEISVDKIMIPVS